MSSPQRTYATQDEPAPQGMRECACGCGRRFPASRRGGHERRFYEPACRARAHRERVLELPDPESADAEEVVATLSSWIKRYESARQRRDEG